MSDVAPQGQDFGTGSGENNAGQGESQGSYSFADDFGNPFLSNLPENERPIVEKYLKQIDAGVTRRFQELHSRYSPYEQFGDIETVQQAVELARMIDESPEEIYAALSEIVGGEQGQGTEFNSDDEEGQFQGLPPAVQERLDQQQRVLEAVAEYILGNEESAQQQAEDSELDSYMENLQTEFGEFDEDFVLAKMLSGMDGEQAVRAYQQAVQKQINQSQQAYEKLPPVLSGGGVVPQEQQSVSQLDRKDIRSLVANIMQQSNQG